MSVDNKVHVLFIDDELGLREVATLFFEAEGFAITTAENGREGIDLLNQKRYDAIVTDIDMPEASGIDVMIAAKKSELNCATEIFILSAKIDATVLAKAHELKITNVFPKPYLMDALAKAITAKVGPRDQQFGIDARLLTPVIDGTKFVMEHYFGETVTVGAPSIRRDLAPMGLVTCMLALHGSDFIGTLLVSAEKPFLAALAHRLFDGQIDDPRDELMTDLLKELCNQIGGKIQGSFARSGLEFRLYLPHVIFGGGMLGPLPTQNPTIRFPVTVARVACTIEFSLSDIAEDRFRSSNVTDEMGDDESIEFF